MDTLIALVREGAVGLTGTPNLLVRYYERGIGVGPSEIVSELMTLGDSTKNFVMREPNAAVLAEAPALVADTAFDMDGVGTVMQRHVISMLPTDFGSRVLHVTASASAGQADEIMTEVAIMLESVASDEWATTRSSET